MNSLFLARQSRLDACNPGIIFGYSFGMKTPISILDQFFGAAVRLARRLGISSSGLYSNAVSQLIDENHSLGVRERLDAVYEADPESSQIDPVMTQLQIQSLPEQDW